MVSTSVGTSNGFSTAPVAPMRRLEAELAQQVAHQQEDRGIVIDDENERALGHWTTREV